MARDDAKGNAFLSRGKWFARVSIGGGKQRSRLMPHIAESDAASANARAALIAKLVRELREAAKPEHIDTTIEEVAKAPNDEHAQKVARVVRAIIAGQARAKPSPISAGATYRDVRKMLTDGDLHRRFPDVVDDISEEHAQDITAKAERYIEPVLRDLPITAINLDHALEVMRLLPSKYSQSWRRHIAWGMHRVLELAVYPLRLIPANPLPPKFMPKKGKPRAKGFLFPHGDAALMRGLNPKGEVAVPLWWRVLAGFLAREGPRKEEAANLQWSDKRSRDAAGWVDLDNEWLYLEEHKTADDTGARDWRLDPGVAEALRRWRKLQPNKARYVFGEAGDDAPNVDHLPDQLRAHLLAVGVKRPELHESSRTRRRMVAHDLRGVFVTTAMASGRSEAWITRRTGHTTSEMLKTYRRAAENLAEGGEAALAPLVEALPEFAAKPKAPAARSPKRSSSGPSSRNASTKKSKRTQGR